MSVNSLEHPLNFLSISWNTHLSVYSLEHPLNFLSIPWSTHLSINSLEHPLVCHFPGAPTSISVKFSGAPTCLSIPWSTHLIFCQFPGAPNDTLRAIRHRQRSTPGGHLLVSCIYRRTGPDLPDHPMHNLQNPGVAVGVGESIHVCLLHVFYLAEPI